MCRLWLESVAGVCVCRVFWLSTWGYRWRFTGGGGDGGGDGGVVMTVRRRRGEIK